MINTIEDYIACVTLLHEFFQKETCTGSELYTIADMQVALENYERELGDELLKILSPYDCYRLSETVFMELTGGNSERQITLHLVYRALRSAGLSDIPF